MTNTEVTDNLYENVRRPLWPVAFLTVLLWLYFPILEQIPLVCLLVVALAACVCWSLETAGEPETLETAEARHGGGGGHHHGGGGHHDHHHYGGGHYKG